MEQPGLYRHPAPFCTNPYWDEEIVLGPGPPKRKGDKGGSKNPSTRALNTAGRGSSVTSSGCLSMDSGSSPTMVPEDRRLSGDDWNRQRYQREDEELWGSETHKASQRIKNALAKAESSVGSTLRMIEGRLGKGGMSREEETSPYLIARNPPVNDLHPPVVSTQTSIGATRWMLQPPPSAKIMEGKERANRSRSVSRGSNRRGGSATSLSRQITGRAMEGRLKRGETLSDLDLDSRHLRPVSQIRTHRSSSPSAPLLDLARSSVDSISPPDEGTPCKRRHSPCSIVTNQMPQCTESDPHNTNGPSPYNLKNHEPGAPLPLQVSSTGILNSMVSLPQKQSQNTKSKPASPTTRLNFPGAESYRFPSRVEQENNEPIKDRLAETA